jgi:hypothetical protein
MLKKIVVIEDSQAAIHDLKVTLSSYVGEVLIIGYGPSDNDFAKSRNEIFERIAGFASKDESVVFLIDHRLGTERINGQLKQMLGCSLVPTLREDYPNGVFLCISSISPKRLEPYDGAIQKDLDEEHEREYFRRSLKKYL